MSTQRVAGWTLVLFVVAMLFLVNLAFGQTVSRKIPLADSTLGGAQRAETTKVAVSSLDSTFNQAYKAVGGNADSQFATVQFVRDSGGGAGLTANSVDSSHVKDGSLIEADLKVTNSAIEGYVLAWDTLTQSFEWVVNGSGVGDNLGNHTATQDIEVGGFSIDGDSTYTSRRIGFDADNDGQDEIVFLTGDGGPSTEPDSTLVVQILGGLQWAFMTQRSGVDFDMDTMQIHAITPGGRGMLGFADSGGSHDDNVTYLTGDKNIVGSVYHQLPNSQATAGAPLLTADVAGVMSWTQVKVTDSAAASAVTATTADSALATTHGSINEWDLSQAVKDSLYDADNLGNHTATQDLNLAGYVLETSVAGGLKFDPNNDGVVDVLFDVQGDTSAFVQIGNGGSVDVYLGSRSEAGGMSPPTLTVTADTMLLESATDVANTRHTTLLGLGEYGATDGYNFWGFQAESVMTENVIWHGPAANPTVDKSIPLFSTTSNITWGSPIRLVDSSEVITDLAGGMVTGNTESGISVVFQDGDNTVDFTVQDLDSSFIKAGAISFSDIGQNTANTNEIPKWSGSYWLPAADDDVPESGDFGAGVALESDGSLSVNVIDSTHIKAGAVSFSDIGANGADSNYIPKWNGTYWVPAPDETGTPGSGDLTDVLSGNDIVVQGSAGPTPTVHLRDTINIVQGNIDTVRATRVHATGMLTMPNSTIVTDYINNDAVTAAKIPDNGLTNADINEGTGAWDFGAATSVEIPNGTNPIVDAAGEIAYDSDDNALRVYDGANSVIMSIPAVRYFSATIYQPHYINDTCPEGIPILAVETQWAPFGIRLTSLGIKTSAQSTYSVNFEEWTAPNDGTPGTLHTVATSTSMEASISAPSISDDFVAAGNILYVDLPSGAGGGVLNYVQIWGTYYVEDGD